LSARRVLAPCQDVVDLGQQDIALGNAEWFVHAARHGGCTMNTLAGNRRDDLLPVLAQLHAFHGNFGIFIQHAHDVALRRIAAETEQQIGR